MTHHQALVNYLEGALYKTAVNACLKTLQNKHSKH